MPTGQSFAAGNAGIAMTFSIRKDDSQFDAAIDDARKSIAKRLEGLPAKLARIDTTDAVGQAANDIKQGIEKQLNIRLKGTAAAAQLIQQGIPLSAIESSGTKYGKAGGAELRAAEMRLQQQPNATEFSGTFSARAGYSAAAARAKGHGPSWIGGDYSTPASVGMAAGEGFSAKTSIPRILSAERVASLSEQLSGSTTIKDETFGGKARAMIDSSLMYMAKRGPLVAAVVASAAISGAASAAVMAPVVTANYGGWNQNLAMRAGQQSIAMGAMQGLGQIPILGAPFSAMAQKWQAEIGWAQESARNNVLLPYQSQSLRASAKGDTATQIMAERRKTAEAMHAEQLSLVNKLQGTLSGHHGPSVNWTGDIYQDPVNKSRFQLGDWANRSVGLTPEQLEIQKNIKLKNSEREAFRLESVRIEGEARDTLTVFKRQFVAGAENAQAAMKSAQLKATGGSPVESFKLETGSDYRTMIMRQQEERAKIQPGTEGYTRMMAKQEAERGQFGAETQWKAMQFTYSAPMAWAGSAGEATAQSAASSMRMEQAQELGRETNQLLEQILQAMKGEGSSAYNVTGP